MSATLLAAFGAGMLSVLSPCVLPLLPILAATAAAEGRAAPLALAAGLAVSFSVTGIALATIGFAAGLDDEIEGQEAAMAGGLCEAADPGFGVRPVGDALERHGDRAGSDRRAVERRRQYPALPGDREAADRLPRQEALGQHRPRGVRRRRRLPRIEEPHAPAGAGEVRLDHDPAAVKQGGGLGQIHGFGHGQADAGRQRVEAALAVQRQHRRLTRRVKPDARREPVMQRGQMHGLLGDRKDQLRPLARGDGEDLAGVSL